MDVFILDSSFSSFPPFHPISCKSRHSLLRNHTGCKTMLLKLIVSLTNLISLPSRWKLTNSHLVRQRCKWRQWRQTSLCWCWQDCCLTRTMTIVWCESFLSVGYPFPGRIQWNICKSELSIPSSIICYRSHFHSTLSVYFHF